MRCVSLLARRAGTMLLLAATLGVFGCRATSAYMRPLPAGPLAGPQPNLAQVVFIRPSSLGMALKFVVLDHNGRFMGESISDSHFAVALPPGRYVFIVWAENTAALQAELAPGRTYFVEVATRMGALSARAHLLAITPRTASWAMRDAWLANTERLEPDFVAGQGYLQARAPDVAERIRRGLEHLQKYDAAELAERTIRPEDGI